VEWSEDGVNVNGRKLNHLRFADDIVLISNNTNDLQARLQELNNSSKISGMKINMNKTKVMFNKQIFAQPIYIEEQELEKVEDYVYLGHTIKMDNNIMDEVKNRINKGWKSFGQLNNIIKSEIPMCLKRKVFNQCILPFLTYGCETWTNSTEMKRKLQITQRAMERQMLNITRDKKTK